MFRRLYSNLSQRVSAAMATAPRNGEGFRDSEQKLNQKSKRSNSNERTSTDYSLTAAAPTPLRINNPNKKHPCGSILSANANYSHWYAHRYGIPHQNSIQADLTSSSRDLDQLMKLQHTNPNVNLYPFLAMGESLPSDVAERKDDTANRQNDTKAAEGDEIAKSCNENHAHWFKHQYCMVPDWEVDCFQQSRTAKSNYSSLKNGEKELDPIEAHAQPRRDIRSFDFSVRVQRAHLDTRDASKLFNIA